MPDLNDILALAEEIGFTHAGPLAMDALVFRTQVRDMCAADRCRSYNHSWACPPACGELSLWRERASKYKRGLIMQTIGEREDSYDFEGMMEAGARHNQLMAELRRRIAEVPLSRVLHLGAGGCRMCEVCGKQTGEPCRHPDLAVASLETYGVNVSKLAAAAGMKYINGQDTVTYFGAVLFDL